MAKSFPFESRNVDGQWDRAITAKDERDFNKMCWTDGVFSNPVDGLIVSAMGGMTINIKPGGAHIQGARFIEQNNRQITLSSASNTLPRIDRIVLRFDTAEEKRHIDIYLKEGVPATIPSPQDLVRQSNYYELALADIYVPARATEINNTYITDKRLDPEVCGVVVPAIPFEKQSETLWKQLSEGISLVQSALNETTAGELQQALRQIRQDKADRSEVTSGLAKKLDSEKVADYVTSVQNWTANGISGGKIVKYKSGKCEVYGQLTVSTNFSTQRATNIYSTEALTLNFPVTFKSKPTVTATIDDIKNLGFVGYTAPTTTKSTYTLVNVGTNGTYTCKVNWYIVGEV